MKIRTRAHGLLQGRRDYLPTRHRRGVSLRGFGPWVGVCGDALRDHFSEDELAKKAKQWAGRMPGGSRGAVVERNHELWWQVRPDITLDQRGFGSVARYVTRELARLGAAVDEIAGMSRTAKKNG